MWATEGTVPLVTRSYRRRRSPTGIGMKLELIPAGKFLMGSPEDEDGRFDGEGPQHEVEISRAFYLGATR